MSRAENRARNKQMRDRINKKNHKKKTKTNAKRKIALEKRHNRLIRFRKMLEQKFREEWAKRFDSSAK